MKLSVFEKVWSIGQFKIWGLKERNLKMRFQRWKEVRIDREEKRLGKKDLWEGDKGMRKDGLVRREKEKKIWLLKSLKDETKK